MLSPCARWTSARLAGRLLPFALLAGIGSIGGGAYLIPIAPRTAVALLGLGILLTWVGKRATHHTLTQPLGLLLLLVGILTLVVNQFLGRSPLLFQIALALVLPGAILSPRKRGF
jgi:hypothetical protein